MDFYIDPKNEDGPSAEMSRRDAAGAYDWLLNTWAPQANLRPEDRLFLRFPLNFVASEVASWNNARKQPLLAALQVRAARPGFQVGLYLPMPPIDISPALLAGDLFGFARYADAGLEIDASFLTDDGRMVMALAVQRWKPNSYTPQRQVRIEPVWDRACPLLHEFDAVATEEYVATRQNGETWWTPPKVGPGPKLHVWFHRAYAAGTPRETIVGQMHEFCHAQRQQGFVPRLPLSLAIYMGCHAADFDPLDGGNTRREPRNVPPTLAHPWKGGRAPVNAPLAHAGPVGARPASPLPEAKPAPGPAGAIPDALPPKG